nr:MAG TPA: hypothetical protein [Caudoviricetes sp.]
MYSTPTTHCEVVGVVYTKYLFFSLNCDLAFGDITDERYTEF